MSGGGGIKKEGERKSIRKEEEKKTEREREINTCTCILLFNFQVVRIGEGIQCTSDGFAGTQLRGSL